MLPFEEGTRVLDLGGGDASMLSLILEPTDVEPSDVVVADIDPKGPKAATERHGYQSMEIAEAGPLPFDDNEFDIVVCSSVIEHVTVGKGEVWNVRSGRTFANASRASQTRFAAEICRVGRGYYVQTPNKWFPVEAHTWLPFVSFLPRRAQVRLLRTTNRIWIKRTQPDWYLLTRRELSTLFPEAEIVCERFFGLTKSLAAVHRPSARLSRPEEALPTRRAGPER